jgi:predicted flap endonuclease-1-like 5' DNA nuclease
LLATGTVEANLSEDDRTVRALHAEEVLAQRPPQPQVSKIFPFSPRERVVTRVDQAIITRREGEAPASAKIIPLRVPAAPAAPAIAPAAEVSAPEQIADDYRITRAPMLHVVPSAPGENVEPMPLRARAGLTDRLDRVEAPPPRFQPRSNDNDLGQEDANAPAASRRFHLSPDDNVVDGPSIGPKTAERLHPHGIMTVRDLLKVEPAALSVLVNARHITSETIAGWQDQARLMCTVPGLRGTHAQLLVGAGYNSGDAIADAEPDKLCADVLAFAVTTAGLRLLRNGEPPDIEKIKGWLEAARSMQAA